MTVAHPDLPLALATTPVARTMAARAAETIAKATGQTVAGLVNGRALRQHADGLTQYLALRLGDVGRARRAMAELRSELSSRPVDELASGPSMRARLYRMARDAAFTSDRGDTVERMRSRRDLPWAQGPSGQLPALALRIVRSDLPDETLELLELRHVRDLAPDEIAYVIDADVDALYSALDDATRLALDLLEGSARSGGHLRSLLRDALSLVLDDAPVEARDAAGDWLPLPKGTVIGRRYALERRVGSGAFGDVYRATDTAVPGHVIALKLLHQPAHSEEAREAAMREIRHIASVFHPSLVQFKDHGWYEGRLFFVMPWYEGETLEARIRREPLSRGEAHDLFVPLARALATLHAAGIRHQDVKPENIFLARLRHAEDEVLPVLLDLGVAAKEAEMVVAGTPTYFAPEVASQFVDPTSGTRVTAKADVYSMALALRNALEPEAEEVVGTTGVEKFIAARAASTPRPFRRRDLRYLDATFRRFLAQDPEARPDAETLARDLAVLVAPEKERARRRSIAAVAIPLATLLLGVSSVIGFQLAAKIDRKSREAERASLAARSLREDLAASESRRERLAAESDRIAALLEHGRLSRDELATHLARTETALTEATDKARVARTEVEALRGSLGEARTREDALRGSVTDAETRATHERERAVTAEERAARRTDDLDRANASLREATSRMRALEETAAGLEDRLAAERARANELDRAVVNAREATARALAARDQAEDEVARLRRERRSSKATGHTTRPLRLRAR